MKRLLCAFVAGITVSACIATPDEEPVSETAEELTREGAVTRALAWANAKLHYCQAPNGQRDYDAACPTYCRRTANAAWDRYRSDCSGLVSWAWGLAPPGRVTSTFAPFDTAVSRVIAASDLAPGDAVNSSGHIMLFEKWTEHGRRAVFIEEPGCSSSRPYAHETPSDVSTSGSSIYVAAHGRAFTAIRFTGIEAAPPPPPAPALEGRVEEASCDHVRGTANGEVVVAIDGAHAMKVAGKSFSVELPLAMKDGAPHVITARASDGPKSVLLGNGKHTLTCAPPVPPLAPAVAVRRALPALAAWKLDAYDDVAHEPKSIADAYPIGAPLSERPIVVESDDGAPEIWVVDGPTRRHVVDPGSLAAWHFRAATWPAAKVSALAEGPAWPSRPFALTSTSGGGDVFVLDVRESPPAGTPPAPPITDEPPAEDDPPEADPSPSPRRSIGARGRPDFGDTAAGCDVSARARSKDSLLLVVFAVAAFVAARRRGTT